jgi:hypothetical protein
MKRLRSSDVLFLIVGLVCQPKISPAVPPGADSEAAHGLDVLKQLITRENFKDYGLTSIEEVSLLKLIGGVDVFYVFNDDLKAAAERPEKVPITPSQTRVYPVTVNGRGCLLITIRYREGQWRTAAFGGLGEASSLARMISTQQTLKSSSARVYEVEIPSLDLAYGAVEAPNTDSNPTLFPLSSKALRAANPGLAPGADLRFAHVSGFVSARQLFTILAPIAKRLNEGSPPR